MAIERVTITALWYGGMNVQNVMHFSNPDGFLTPQQVAEEIRDGWITIVKAKQSAYLSWRDISVDTLGNPAPPFHLPIVLGGADAVDSGLSHPTVNWKLRITTGVGGKRGRGRIYIPGIRYSHWQFGQMTAFGVTDMQPTVDALKARYVGSGASSDISLGVAPREDGEDNFLLATNLTMSLTPGIQRRRNIGVGI